MATIDAYRRSADSAAARLATTDTVLAGIVDKLTASKVAALARAGIHQDAGGAGRGGGGRAPD